MANFVFDEKTLLDGNIFQFEQRLHTRLNKYVENGAILCTYFSRNGDETTLDLGTLGIDEYIGKRSPLRFNMILDFPIYGMHATNPEDDEEVTVHDIRVDGDALIIPTTIMPKQYDLFIINHLKMTALFEVTSVTFDSMKQDGFYKIHYRLHSTENEIIEQLKSQCVKTFHTDLNDVGTESNPIITEDDYVKKVKVIRMLNHMISLYRSMYYNERHNCFLFYDQSTGCNLFDMCGHDFIGRHSLMNSDGNPNVIILHDKLQDSQFDMYYFNSIYSWIELGCPSYLVQKFPYITSYTDGYPYSSFSMWNEGNVQVIQPIKVDQDRLKWQQNYFLSEKQFQAFMETEYPSYANEYELLLWKYIHTPDKLSLKDISLHLADTLINGDKYKWETFLFTPIMIYIIRKILRTS